MHRDIVCLSHLGEVKVCHGILIGHFDGRHFPAVFLYIGNLGRLEIHRNSLSLLHQYGLLYIQDLDGYRLARSIPGDIHTGTQPVLRRLLPYNLSVAQTG